MNKKRKIPRSLKFRGAIYKRAVLKEELIEKFDALAAMQRGAPERAMHHVQEICGNGVMSFAVEHTGDIIHRMTEKVTFPTAGYTYVKNKVEKVLDTLTNRYGFEREFKENIAESAKYRNVDKEELEHQCNDALRKYAYEHSKLPVYNEAQKLAQQATMSLGYGKFRLCIHSLEELSKHLESVEEWVEFAHQYSTPN